MPDEKKPIYWMVLFGVCRWALGLIGMWLKTRGLIDDDTHRRMVSEGATDAAAYLLMLAPLVWTIAQKWQVIGWLKTALHMNAAQTPGDVVKNAPGPDMPV